MIGNLPAFPRIPRTRSGLDADHEQDADGRDQAASARDQVSEARDKDGENRDAKAELRDRYAEARDRFDETFDAAASSDRLASGKDRHQGARDRNLSAGDRRASLMDRVVSAHDRQAASVDELTGAHRRDPGMLELSREVDRAKRINSPFVLAFVDVDGLKAINDTLGHYAGDELLSRVANTMRAHLRSYDLIIRFGGDEFICGLAALSISAAAERFKLINAKLQTDRRSSISVGLAALGPADILETLTARAHKALRSERETRSTARR